MKSKIHEHQKNNFKIVSNKLIIAALLVFGFSSFAQDQPQPVKKMNKGQKEKMSPEQRSQGQLDQMTAELNLDAKQQEQIKPIIAEQTAKREAMKAERMAEIGIQKKMTDEEREVLKQKRKGEREALDTKLKAILTPEQFQKMEANGKEGMKKMREARENKPKE